MIQNAMQEQVKQNLSIFYGGPRGQSKRALLETSTDGFIQGKR